MLILKVRFSQNSLLEKFSKKMFSRLLIINNWNLHKMMYKMMGFLSRKILGNNRIMKRLKTNLQFGRKTKYRLKIARNKELSTLVQLKWIFSNKELVKFWSNKLRQKISNMNMTKILQMKWHMMANPYP
jgi:hypothetical protein